jgi:HAD superfamily hydrolase (TIGR01450 family)
VITGQKLKKQMTPNANIPIIKNVASLPLAKAWICDIWGVLHNGVDVYLSAVDACRQFRRAGGIVILVSNAPRPSSGVLRQFESLGIGNDVYDIVLTSGDVTRTMLQQYVGTLFDGLNIPRVNANDAKFILCSGLFDDTRETPDNYNELLNPLVARHVPMLCANPDVKVDRGGTIIYCAGAVAERYTELGGQVAYAGKPHAPIYQVAYAEIERIHGKKMALSDILAIGDGVETDIRGGVKAGLRTLYVTSAIHMASPLEQQGLANLFPNSAMRPSAATERLAW